MALFLLRMSYHAQRYMLRSLLTRSFNIVNAPIILLFSKKWVPGLAAEDNRSSKLMNYGENFKIWKWLTSKGQSKHEIVGY